MAKALDAAIRKHPWLRDEYPALGIITEPPDHQLHFHAWCEGATNLLWLCLCAVRVARIFERFTEVGEFDNHREKIGKTVNDRFWAILDGEPKPSLLSGPLKARFGKGGRSRSGEDKDTSNEEYAAADKDFALNDIKMIDGVDPAEATQVLQDIEEEPSVEYYEGELSLAIAPGRDSAGRNHDDTNDDDGWTPEDDALSPEDAVMLPEVGAPPDAISHGSDGQERSFTPQDVTSELGVQSAGPDELDRGSAASTPAARNLTDDTPAPSPAVPHAVFDASLDTQENELSSISAQARSPDDGMTPVEPPSSQVYNSSPTTADVANDTALTADTAQHRKGVEEGPATYSSPTAEPNPSQPSLGNDDQEMRMAKVEVQPQPRGHTQHDHLQGSLSSGSTLVGSIDEQLQVINPPPQSHGLEAVLQQHLETASDTGTYEDSDHELPPLQQVHPIAIPDHELDANIQQQSQLQLQQQQQQQQQREQQDKEEDGDVSEAELDGDTSTESDGEETCCDCWPLGFYWDWPPVSLHL
jgi:hypothetical protein